MRPWTLHDQRLLLRLRLTSLEANWATVEGMFEAQAETKERGHWAIKAQWKTLKDTALAGDVRQEIVSHELFVHHLTNLALAFEQHQEHVDLLEQNAGQAMQSWNTAYGSDGWTNHNMWTDAQFYEAIRQQAIDAASGPGSQSWQTFGNPQ